MKGLSLLFTASVFIAFLFTGCQKDIDHLPKDLKASAKAGIIGMPIGSTMCPGTEVIPLFAGQFEPAGMISYSVQSNMLILCAASTCDLSEQHIFVGLEEDLPTSGNGGLIPGQFANSDNGENTTWIFDLSSLAEGMSNYCIVIAYHAVGCGETIWGKGFDRGRKGNWSSYTEICIDNFDN